MNPYHTFLATSFPLLAFSSPLQAIEAPEDDAPPPVVEPADESVAETKAFIGVISQPVPDLLRDHLSLNPNQGVLIQSVIPDGPAAKAGLSVNDIITSVEGSEITNPDDLSRAIAKQKPGDKIRCAVIHQGKPAQLDVTLGSRPDHFSSLGKSFDDAAGEPLRDLGLPDDFANRIRQMIEDGEQGFGFRMLDGGDIMEMPDLEKMRRQMKGNVRELQLNLGGDGQVNGFRGGSIAMKDAEGSVEIQSTNDSKEVTVRDPDGKVIWSGPWDTPQDKAAAPEEIRERIGKIDTRTLSGGFQFHFGQPDE